jgi:hypothetical protein
MSRVARWILVGLFGCIVIASGLSAKLVGDELRVGYFQVDATPPLGSPMAYDPCTGVTDPLSLRGVVILGSGKPVVLAAIDWLGVANDAHDDFCERLAQSLGTDKERVSLHALHQHDAPRYDIESMRLLEQAGSTKMSYDRMLWQRVVSDCIEAVKNAAEKATVADHVGYSEAEVKEVASNRRLLDTAGKVVVTRFTATADASVRAMPVGTIDPKLRMISFWNGDKPIVAMSYYATHPQSYYRTGKASTDFPGIARDNYSAKSGVPLVHFNGAAGNVGAGKWNDGSKENRAVLASKVEDGMKRAWDAMEKRKIRAEDVEWKSIPVKLKPAAHLQKEKLEAIVADGSSDPVGRLSAAEHLSYLLRFERGGVIDLGRLRLGDLQVLHMPGELFVEYQLAAAKMVPGGRVAMAAYGNYGTMYIGTAIAYQQGGYETSQRATCVDADAEKILVKAMAELLGAKGDLPGPLGVPADAPVK